MRGEGFGQKFDEIITVGAMSSPDSKTYSHTHVYYIVFIMFSVYLETSRPAGHETR